MLNDLYKKKKTLETSRFLHPPKPWLVLIYAFIKKWVLSSLGTSWSEHSEAGQGLV